MIVPVSFDDVNSRYLEGDLADRYDQSKVETQIQDAVDYASGRWGDRIRARLASGRLTENLYKRVIADAVLRVTRNPEGFSNESDGSYAYGLRAQVASGNLWFTDDDIETLAGVQGKTFPGTIGVGLDRGWS
jgi:hypothetical protein